MPEDPKYLEDLEKELSAAGGSLDRLLSKSNQPDNSADKPQSAELRRSKILATASHKASLTLTELLRGGIVPRDMPAEDLVEFLAEYSKKLAEENNQTD